MDQIPIARCRTVALWRALLAGGAVLLATACQPALAPSPASGPLADITILSSRAFGGRQAGTAGDDSAALFIARRYQALHLRPAFHRVCAAKSNCPASYYQFFGTPDGVRQNVGAVIDGRDSSLRTQYVVIGAHFDHLGYSTRHSRDPANGYVLRPGADDNASGTAAVLELADRLSRRPTRRSILLLNFDAEEDGLLGSRAFIASAVFPPTNITFMLNLDMIGRLRGNRVFIEGVSGRSIWHSRIDSLARAAGLRADFVWDQRRSDHASFEDAGDPVAFLTTGEHPDYHTARDVASRINGPGLLTVIDAAEQIARSAADQ